MPAQKTKPTEGAAVQTDSSSKAELVGDSVSSEIKSSVSREQAETMHIRLRNRVTKAANNLAADVIEIGKDLRDIKAKNAWAYFSKSWTEYLEQYREFSRSYIFSIAKLGQADEKALKKFLDLGIGATQLIEYARLAPSASEIESLVDTTWEEVKELPVKQMAEKVKEKVVEIKPLKTKSAETAGKPRGRKPRTWLKRFEDLYAQVPLEEQAAFAKAVRKYLRELDKHDESVEPSA
jgi:hypothetical protein